MSRMTTGASPNDSSSQSSIRGLDIKARPIAAICCCPPDNDVAGRRRNSLQPREQLIDAR